MSQKHLGAKSQVEGAKSVFYVSLSQEAKADAGAPGAHMHPKPRSVPYPKSLP